MNLLSRFANYFARVYHATPVGFRWLYWVVPLLYLISKVDLLPDMIRPFGVLDDILFGLFFFWMLDRAKVFEPFFKDANDFKKRHQGGDDRGFQHAFERQTPLQILDLEPGADQATIKKAYRKQMALYHPDKFAHLGPEFEETARRRSQAITAAYEQLVTDR